MSGDRPRQGPCLTERTVLRANSSPSWRDPRRPRLGGSGASDEHRCTGRPYRRAADTLSGVSSPRLLAWRPDPAADATAIEEHLRANTDSGDRSLTSIAALSTATARPRELAAATVVAATLAGGADASAPLTDAMIDIAVAVELVEVGTECHDDVIGQVTTRFGEATANHVHGDLQAILAGDFLIARASELAAAHGTEIASELATTIGWLCEGRHRELDAAPDTSTRLENLRLRTARLHRSAMRIGALFAGADAETEATLADAGEELGMALAIEADARRFALGDPSIERTAVDDLVAGRWTVPATLVDEPMPGDRAGWRSWHADAVASGVVDEALDMARERLEAAVAALGAVDAHPLLDLLPTPSA